MSFYLFVVALPRVGVLPSLGATRENTPSVVHQLINKFGAHVSFMLVGAVALASFTIQSRLIFQDVQQQFASDCNM